MRLVPFLVIAAVAASPVAAHPKLVSASPAPNSSNAAPKRLQLTFSERLVARFSGADLVMTQMPGMKMNTPMKIGTRAAVGPDGKSLIVAPATALSAGVYRLDYHVVSNDTHRVQGSYDFQVK